MGKLHFDIRDIFRTVRLGWSGKKIWVGLCGLILAYAGYSILVTVAHLLSGATWSGVWHRYGLFPGALWGELPLVGIVVHVVAMLFALAVIFLTSCMICKITYQQLRGDDFFSSGDAWRFIKANWSGVLFGPVAALALFVFFLVAGMIMGWVAHLVPVAGELLFALSFIPIFFAALVAVFIAIAFVVAFAMSPAIVGTVGEDTLEVVIQSFSLAWSQPWRLVFYTAWMVVSVTIGATLLYSFMIASFCLITWACGLSMDVKLANMFQIARHYVPFDFTTWKPVMEHLPAPGTPSGAEVWSGRILGVMLCLLTGVFISYVQSAYASGLSLIYVILRRRKDDENLLEWEDEDLSEEVAPPETGEEDTSEEAADDSAQDEGLESEEGAAGESAEEGQGDGSESRTEGGGNP